MNNLPYDNNEIILWVEDIWVTATPFGITLDFIQTVEGKRKCVSSVAITKTMAEELVGILTTKLTEDVNH